jgi:hypothetical protein
MKTRCFMLVLVLLVVVPIGFAQQAPGPEFDAYVNKALKDWEVPGVAKLQWRHGALALRYVSCDVARSDARERPDQFQIERAGQG